MKKNGRAWIISAAIGLALIAAGIWILTMDHSIVGGYLFISGVIVEFIIMEKASQGGKRKEDQLRGLRQVSPNLAETSKNNAGQSVARKPQPPGNAKTETLPEDVAQFFYSSMNWYQYEKKLNALSESDRKRLEIYVQEKTEPILKAFPGCVFPPMMKRGYDFGFCFYYRNNKGSELDFASVPHPFLSRNSRWVPDCAVSLLRFLNDSPPLEYRIDEAELRVVLYTGYINTTYTESADCIRYTSICQESTHDGGGYDNYYFTLISAPDKPIPKSLQFEGMCGGLQMPPSAGYWLDADGRCFLVDPFGMQGVFELWMEHRFAECGWGDEPETIKETGHPPRS